MRILHVGPSAIPVDYPLGGAVQRRMLALAKEQARGGHEVLLVSPERDGNVRCDVLERGCAILRVPCRLPRPWRDLELLARMLWVLRGESFNILHAHATPFAALARRVAVRAVLTFDFFRFAGSERRVGRFLYRRLLQRFSRCVAVSDFCRDEFVRFYGFERPVDVVYNGVDRESFCPSTAGGARARRLHDVPRDGLLYLFAGRFCEQKGSDLLLDAFTRLTESRPDARLLLVGPSEQFGREGPPELGGAAKQDPRIIWAGARPDVELIEAMNAADVALLPTRRDEMFGMAALEALSCGTPVIASRLGGIPEVVSERTGWFFAAGDVSGLTDRMIQAADEGERRPRAEAARSSTERFSWSRVATDFDGVYASVAEVEGDQA